MYDRKYEGRELQFEASGGLIHASLILQDKQTNSYWALMKGESIAGDFKGTRLRELPVSQKMMWRDWRSYSTRKLWFSRWRELSTSSRTTTLQYLNSSEGFRGVTAKDGRLATKTPVYVFRLDGEAYAVPHRKIRKGASFQAADEVVFLYRPNKAKVVHSTVAFILSEGRYRKGEQGWMEESTGAVFDPGSGSFQGAASSRRLSGFDTFWYNWSLNNPDTRLLKKKLK